MSNTDNSHGHDAATSGPPSAEVIKRGYEEDRYDAKSVISVPLLVVMFFVLAFGTVSILFAIYSKPNPADPMAYPGRDWSKKTVNERISETQARTRPEPLKLRYRDPRAITSIEIEGVNSPEYHAEDLLPNKDTYPDLYKRGPERISLDQSMTLDDKTLARLLPSRETASRPATSQFAPSGANAGRGAEESPVTVKELPQQTAPQPKGGKQ
jgi:hypothetical protein